MFGFMMVTILLKYIFNLKKVILVKRVLFSLILLKIEGNNPLIRRIIQRRSTSPSGSPKIFNH